MRAKLRPVVAVVVLTIVIATVSTLPLWLVAPTFPPAAALLVVLTSNPAGPVLVYGLSGLTAVAVLLRLRKSEVRP